MAIAFIGEKICKNCGELKDIIDFGVLKRNADGRNIYCRECIRDLDEKRRIRGRKQFWKSRPVNPARIAEPTASYGKVYSGKLAPVVAGYDRTPR